MKKTLDARKNLKDLGNNVVEQIEKKQNPALDIPIRTLSNIKFNSDTRRIEMGQALAKRYFFNIAHVRKFTQTVEVAALSKELLDVNKHLSLREVFYRMKRTLPNSKVNIVDEQVETDQAIEDLELVANVPREQLHINANKMGSVAGNVVIEDKGDIIDWSKLGSGGWAIPSNVENIIFKKVKTKFVIYMEKAAEWERLHEDRVWEKLNCLIMSSQGQATRGVRRLLQRLHLEHKMPIYVLVDGDPWGIYIYSVLKFGSIGLAHISEKLTIPDCRMLGLTADDVTEYDLKRHLIKFEEVDRRRLEQVKNYEWFKNSKEWQRQFKMWKELDGKVELAALASKDNTLEKEEIKEGKTFISAKYIPNKIKNKEWLD